MPPLECKVCRNNYNNNENLPLLLPCSRTLCRSCVRRVLMDDKSMKCPVCYGSHYYVFLEDLKVNYEIVDATSLTSYHEAQTGTSQRQDGIIMVVLMTMNGKKYNLKVPASATVKEVKCMIKEKYGFEPTFTRLLFQGCKLKDNYTLAFYKVEDGNILQMSTSYIGGGSPAEERDE